MPEHERADHEHEHGETNMISHWAHYQFSFINRRLKEEYATVTGHSPLQAHHAISERKAVQLIKRLFGHKGQSPDEDLDLVRGWENGWTHFAGDLTRWREVVDGLAEYERKLSTAQAIVEMRRKANSHARRKRKLQLSKQQREHAVEEQEKDAAEENEERQRASTDESENDEHRSDTHDRNTRDDSRPARIESLHARPIAIAPSQQRPLSSLVPSTLRRATTASASGPTNSTVDNSDPGRPRFPAHGPDDPSPSDEDERAAEQDLTSSRTEQEPASKKATSTPQVTRARAVPLPTRARWLMNAGSPFHALHREAPAAAVLKKPVVPSSMPSTGEAQGQARAQGQ